MTSVLLVVLAISPLSQDVGGFGRFGYAKEGRVPAFKLSSSGFKVNFASADTFVFPAVSKLWKPLNTTSTQQIVTLSGGYQSPTKLKQDLLSPGFSLFYPNGFSLKIGSMASPYLSWGEGTLDANTGFPTPKTNWALLSFRDNQPPVLFAFPSKPASLKLWGKPGEWYVGNDASFAGWMRVAAPTGTMPNRTNTAGELGQLVNVVKMNEKWWTQAAPILLNRVIRDDGQSIEVDYVFDKPGAIVPPAAVLAALGGSSLKVLTPTKRISSPNEDGPLDVTTSRILTLRTIARRVPTGRAVHRGEAAGNLSTASFLDVQSVVELALGNTLASAESSLRKLAEETYAEFLTEAIFEVEPCTGQSLPYEADGKNLDLVAAHALLMQSTISARRPTSEGNSLLSSLSWRRDWLTWKFLGVEPNLARRSAALVAITGAMAPEPERRLEAALFEAGLAAEVGLERWRKRRGDMVVAVNYAEILPAIRADLYGALDYRRAAGFGAIMLSPIRSYGDEPLWVSGEKSPLELNLLVPTTPVLTTLASGFPIQIRSATPNWTVEQGLGLSIIKGTAISSGKQTFSLELESVANIPLLSLAPQFQQSERKADPR